MMKSILIVGSFGLLISAVSCQEMNLENSDTCFSTEFVYPRNILGPDSALVNEEIAFNLNVGYKNGCGSFGQYLTTTDSLNVNVETVAAYRGCICSQVALETDTTYVFTPTSAGIYRFNFKNGESTFDTKEVIVTE